MFAFLIVLATLLAVLSGFYAVMVAFAAREFFDPDAKVRGDARYAGVFFAVSTFSCGYLAYTVLCLAL